MKLDAHTDWSVWKAMLPHKFASAEEVFGLLHPGDRIFMGTACAEPQALTGALASYIKKHPQELFDLELVQLWNPGSAAYADKGLADSVRMHSFFISESKGSLGACALACYNPAFYSSFPDLIKRDLLPIDMALIQTSLPDAQGNMSLGIGVDVALAAANKASIVVAQPNSRMPYVPGDGIINIQDLDYLLPRDEPLLQIEHRMDLPHDVVERIGRNTARIVQDNATLQVGYGPLADSLLAYLKEKKHLGLHSEIFTDGAARLMREGVIDNINKSIDPGASVASLCLGGEETYSFLHKNPDVIFKGIDYTNNQSIISRQRNMTAINAAIEIDLTGQAICESVAGGFHSAAGGQTDFIRSAPLAPGGKSILIAPSASSDGRSSRILPRLKKGSSATVHRGDVRYVVTEYGIAYLYGKSIQERAMDLIAISHPRFRSWLMEEALKLSFLTPSRVSSPVDYQRNLETWRRTKTGLSVFLRPVKMSDEQLLQEFFSSLSDRSSYRRFASVKKYLPRSRLWDILPLDPARGLVILALLVQKQNEKAVEKEREKVIGLAEFCTNDRDLNAELALVVRDDYQGQGVGSILHSYMEYLARRRGLTGLTAEVLEDNLPAIGLITKMGFKLVGADAGSLQMRLVFDEGEERELEQMEEKADGREN